MVQAFSIETRTEELRHEGGLVLVTGAGGHIGSYFARYVGGRFPLRLMVRHADEGKAIAEFGEVVVADLGDLPRMREVCEGVDTVVHLAGDPSPSAAWESLRESNIVGTYNTFVAAKAAGCRRVVYASSIHAVSGYPADYQVHADDPVNPGDLYGVSKCFGEALARYMAVQEALSAIVLRIGAFQPAEAAAGDGGVEMLDAWVSERDLAQLIERSIAVRGVRFAILHGLSDNRFKRMDITEARELVGYRPADDVTRVNPTLAKLKLSEVPTHSVADARQESGIREELRRAAEG